MSIQEHLNKIRNAVYGHEVRESIAKGIETAYDDASENGNANMEVKIARGTNPNLNARLNEMDETDRQTTTQLAQKIPQGVGGVTDSDLSQEVKEQMTGGSVAVVGKDAILTENIVDKQVTASKLGILSTGVNLFNGDFTDLTILSSGKFTQDVQAKVVIVPIVGGQTYFLRKDRGNSSRLGWAISKPTLSSVGETIDYVHGNAIFGSTGIVAPDDANYMVYMASYAEGGKNYEIKLQVTETDQPFFVGYDFLSMGNINGLKKEIDEIASMIGTESATLYNGVPLLKIDYVAKTITIPSNIRTLSNGKRIVLTEGLSFDFNDNTSNLYMALTYKKNTTSLKLHYMRPDSQLPKDESLIAIINPTKPEIFGLDMELCEVNGEMFVPDQTKTFVEAKISEISGGDSLRSSYYFLDDLTGVYEKPVDMPSGATETQLALETSSHTLIYSIFDNLVTNFPTYVTKEVVGVDSSGLNINQYTFKSPRIGNSKELPLRVPKVVMISAVHGYEQASAYVTAQFFKDLCENWEVKPQLEFMRWNVDFAVIPVANPYGYDNNQRKNYNGIDINRNFFEGTKTSGDPSEDYFGGFEGMSEPETQVISSFIEDNLDAEFYIDYHNIAGGYPMSYTSNEDNRTLTNNLYKTLTKKWAKDYVEAPKDVMMGYLNDEIPNTTIHFAESKGMNVVLLETPWVMPFATAKYDKTTLETAIEALGNLFVTIAKSWK